MVVYSVEAQRKRLQKDQSCHDPMDAVNLQIESFLCVKRYYDLSKRN